MTIRTRSFDVYCDPGHAWVKVKRTTARLLMGPSFYEITPWSFQRGDYVFLEEDQDAALFLQCLKTQGIHPVWRQHHANRYSRIRNYDTFRP